MLRLCLYPDVPEKHSGTSETLFFFAKIVLSREPFYSQGPDNNKFSVFFRKAFAFLRRYNILSTINRKTLPNGVTVAQLILVQFVEVRILIGQPFLPSVKLLNSLK